MNVERYGAGAQSYFALHGWGGDHHTFAPLAPHVPACASLYAADLPGCGASPVPREWAVDAVLEEIDRAVRATCARRATLVGNCGGAAFAMLAAQRLTTEVVERVVLIDPFAYMPRYFSLFTSGDFGRHAYNATFANPVGRWLTNQSLRGRRAGASDLAASFAGADHEVARRYLVLFGEMGSVEQFRNFAAPVSIAHGEKTFGAVKKSLTLWREALPRARVHVLRGAGHLSINEASAQAAAIIFNDDGAEETQPAKGYGKRVCVSN